MPKIIEGTWPENDIRRAFVEGAKWWEYYYVSSGFTMWQSDQRLAEKEAEKRYGDLPVDKRKTESEIRKELLKYLDYDKVVSGITDSRYTTCSDRYNVQAGGRIMYDRIYSMLGDFLKIPECGVDVDVGNEKKSVPIDRRRSDSEIREELANVEYDYKNKDLGSLPYGKASASVMIMILKWVLNEGDEE